MKPLVFAAFALVASAHAAERPADFAFGAPIRVDGESAIYSIRLPQGVYEGAARADLGDLRIFNAAGEAVPFAFVPRPPDPVAKAVPVALTPFPLRAPAATGIEGLDVRVQRAPDGTIVNIASSPSRAADAEKLVGYLFDTSALKEPLRALELDLVGSGDFVGRVKVEASEDLAAWRTVASDAPIVRLSAEGQRIGETRVAFVPQRAKYLRLSWPAKGPAVELSGVRVEAAETVIEPQRLWASAPGVPAKDRPDIYEFDLGGRFPADRLRVALAQPNTVAYVRLFARARQDAEWRPIAGAVLYRLLEGDREVASPDVRFPSSAERYWQMRVDSRTGGLGGAPRLELGWVAQEVAFAARGSDPFLLAYGNRDAQPAGLAIETLVPGYKRDATGKGGEEAPLVTIAQAKLDEPRAIAGVAALEPRIDWKRVVLWASLVGAVALLGWMAWRLGKRMPPGGDDPRR